MTTFVRQPVATQYLLKEKSNEIIGRHKMKKNNHLTPSGSVGSAGKFISNFRKSYIYPQGVFVCSVWL